MKFHFHQNLSKERARLLGALVRLTETPLMILGFVWLGLLLAELLDKSSKLLSTLGVVIWIIFILDFLLKFSLSPNKVKFLKKNVLTVISLVVPAFRVFRVFRIIRIFRFSRGIRLIKVIGSLNRGMNALSSVMKRRAIGYVIVFTIIIIFIGAAGMYAFEKNANPNFGSYGNSLWRTAMLVISMGIDWPVTTEGRILCFMIATYGLAVFGYITATLATFFIGRDAENKHTEIAGAKQVEELKKELMLLREEIKKLSAH